MATKRKATKRKATKRTKGPDWESLREKVKATDRKVLRKVIGSVDGHTIYKSEHFTDAGLDTEIVAAFTRNLQSNCALNQCSGYSPVATPLK